jgi:hypothetical protein
VPTQGFFCQRIDLTTSVALFEYLQWLLKIAIGFLGTSNPIDRPGYQQPKRPDQDRPKEIHHDTHTASSHVKISCFPLSVAQPHAGVVPVKQSDGSSNQDSGDPDTE